MIDGLCPNQSVISDYQEGYRELLVLRKRTSDLKKQLEEGKKESDYQNFLLDELLQIDLDQCNLEEMQSQLSMHENAEQIAENLKDIFTRTDQDEVGVIDALLDIKNKLAKTAALSHRFGESLERIEAIFVDFKDLVFDLQNKAEKIDIHPEILLKLQESINSIHHLLQKHRVSSVGELIEIRTKIQTEQSNFDGLLEQIVAVDKKIELQEEKIQVLCNTLTENRKKAIPVLSKKMENLLQKLGLEKAKISVHLSPLDSFGIWGKESIELLFQANSGFDLKPIQQAISGGERSRVMLAVKKIMAENTELPTLILDEIDTGVSGKVADEMGKLMLEMSQDLQLIVISHLAQVAAKGNNNYKVVKTDTNGKAQTTIVELNQAEKLQEIAQLLSGATITPAALQQAEELMK
jgi:DNA repair protein RecN (Recombination protein N)